MEDSGTNAPCKSWMKWEILYSQLSVTGHNLGLGTAAIYVGSHCIARKPRTTTYIPSGENSIIFIGSCMNRSFNNNKNNVLKSPGKNDTYLLVLSYEWLWWRSNYCSDKRQDLRPRPADIETWGNNSRFYDHVLKIWSGHLSLPFRTFLCMHCLLLPVFSTRVVFFNSLLLCRSSVWRPLDHAVKMVSPQA